MATEGFILDPTGSSPLDLVSGTAFGMAALTIPPAKRRPEWANSGDADGSELVREPFYDDRNCSMQLRVKATTMDQAVAAIGTLEGKLQEAIKLAAGGGDGLRFLWTPANATVGLTGFIKLAEITDMPVEYASGWFQARPVLTVAFTAKPFLYGVEVAGPTATGTTPVLTVAVPSVPGDVPAEARLVITDGSTQARRWVEWGLEQRYYNAGSPSSLLIDSEDLVTTGFAGAQTVAGGGAYRRAGATHDTVTATLLAQPVAICGTGDQPHIGTFRIKARVWGTTADQYWRLTWRSGDGPFTFNAWVPLTVAGLDPAGGYSEIDLGVITVEPAATGAQKWSGRIEAYTTSAQPNVGEVDYLALFPANEGYGRIEGSYSYTPGVTNGHDEFTGATIGNALNARVAPAGGTWATSGATTDFVFATPTSSPAGIATPVISRTATSDTGYRYAILGSSALTDTEVAMWVYQKTNYPPAPTVDQVLIARWTDASNHMRLRLTAVPINITTTTLTLVLEQVVAGTATVLASTSSVSLSSRFRAYVPPLASAFWVQMRLIAFASGRVLGWLFDANGNLLAVTENLSSVLATGGTLASGPAGLADRDATSAVATRQYDNFYVAIPVPESLVINSGRSLEVRSDSNLRQSSDGATYGDIASRGSRLFIPQAGDAGRTSRIAVRAAREDVVTSASRNDGDSLTLATFYTPRYLAIPR